MSENKKIDILRSVLGSYYFEGQSQIIFHCPNCDHHKKKLSINIGKNLYKCWVCDYSGRNIFRIIKRFGCYEDKKNWLGLAQQTEIENFSEKLFGIKKRKKQSLAMPDNFIALSNKNLPNTSIYPINYLQSRGLKKQDIINWKIGYCNSGHYEGRIIFPSFDLDGDLNYFVARSYINDWKRYLNPPMSSNMIFNHLNLDFLKPITIVEGVFDASKSGINSVPLLGSTLSENSKLLEEIVKNDTTIYLALDGDAKNKTDKLIKLFLKYDIELYYIDLLRTNHQDIGDMTKDEFNILKEKTQLLTSDNYLIQKIMKM